MNMHHKNARLTPLDREGLVRQVASGRHRRPPHEPQASDRGPFGSGSIDVARKDWWACRNDHRGHIGCDSRHRREWSKRLSSCADNAGRANRLPYRSASRQPLSALSCAEVV
jgi:hypothetical protein